MFFRPTRLPGGGWINDGLNLADGVGRKTAQIRVFANQSGTRISLDSIVHAFRRGESPETICPIFELLRLDEVYGAITYYLANQAGVDAYLIRQSEKWVEGKRNAEPLPANLRERLMRARDEMYTTRLS